MRGCLPSCSLDRTVAEFILQRLIGPNPCARASPPRARAGARCRRHGRGWRDQQEKSRTVGDVVEAPMMTPKASPASARPETGSAASARRTPRRDDRAQHHHSAEPDRPAPARTHTAVRASGHYNSRSMSVQVSSRVNTLKNIATRLRIDSVVSTTEAGSGHPRLAARRPDIMARCSLPRCGTTRAIRRIRQRSVRALERARGADPLRGVGGGRLHQARDLLNLRRSTPTSRPSDAPPAFATLRQGRSARGSGGRRHRAQRAPHQVRLPHLRAARRRRDRRRLGLGTAGLGAFDKVDTLCGITTSTRSARAARRSGAQHGGARGALARGRCHAIVVDGHDLPQILDALDEAGARRAVRR